MTIKVEVGKKYRTRDGGTAVVMERTVAVAWPFRGMVTRDGANSLQCIWDEAGRCHPALDHPADLVEEIVEPGGCAPAVYAAGDKGEPEREVALEPEPRTPDPFTLLDAPPASPVPIKPRTIMLFESPGHEGGPAYWNVMEDGAFIDGLASGEALHVIAVKLVGGEQPAFMRGRSLDRLRDEERERGAWSARRQYAARRMPEVTPKLTLQGLAEMLERAGLACRDKDRLSSLVTAINNFFHPQDLPF